MGLREILLKRLQGSGGAGSVAGILAKQASQRIRSGGSDIGGYAPLWANTAKITVGRGKRKREITHYRKGGQPLRDTGRLVQSLSSRLEATSTGCLLILKAIDYALAQHRGFKTSGPNFIPFTRKAVKQHAEKKRTKRGKPSADVYPVTKPDGLVVGKGVTVPARPILVMTQNSKREVARAIARALGAR